MKYRGELTRLEIGDRNTIREFTTIHIGTVQGGGVTRVGHDNWIMTYVHMAHDCCVGSHTIFSSSSQIAGHVSVGDWAIIGGMSGVHQYVRIGEHAMLGGGSALVQDLPPFMLGAGNKAGAYGVNIEGLQRRGFSTDTIQLIRQCYKLIYKTGLTLEDAKLEISKIIKEHEQDKLQCLFDFLASTTRGIARL